MNRHGHPSKTNVSCVYPQIENTVRILTKNIGSLPALNVFVTSRSSTRSCQINCQRIIIRKSIYIEIMTTPIAEQSANEISFDIIIIE